MNRTLAILGSALSLAIASLALIAFRPADAAQGPAGQNPTNHDFAVALDEAAWTYFSQVTASTGRQGAPRFTTWAGDMDTFRPNAAWPVQASGLQLRPTVLPRLLGGPPPGRAEQPGGAHTWLPSLLHDKAQEEVRRNRAAFDYIVNNRLNSRSGLIAAFGTTISFPRDSIEVKTNWLPVDQVPNYYRNADGSAMTQADVLRQFFVTNAAGGARHALLSMHVITRQVPNWTWATFEHQLTPARCDYIGCRDAFGATVPVVPPRQRAGTRYGLCDHTPRLRALLTRAGVSDVFLNYCLKGSQTDYTDPTGLPVLLGNSVTEGGFVMSSSCMTCHGTAGWDSTGASLPISAPVGAIPAQTYWQLSTTTVPRTTSMIQLATAADFVWSIPFCAYDDTGPAGTPPVLNTNCFDPRDVGR